MCLVTLQEATFLIQTALSGKLEYRKRSEFPSGMAPSFRTTMPSWVMSRKWELDVGVILSFRLQDGGGPYSPDAGYSTRIQMRWEFSACYAR
jgi:hypothetical protein